MSCIEDRISEAVRDYRTVWAEPWPLSANLRLMVEARTEIARLKDAIRLWEYAHAAQRDRAIRAEEALEGTYYPRLF